VVLSNKKQGKEKIVQSKKNKKSFETFHMKVLLKIAYISIVFLIGFMAGVIYDFNFNITGESVLETPSDYLSEREILVYNDKIVIMVDNATLSNYGDTGSMDPVFGKGANGIRIKPGSEEEINIGDIISFNYGNRLVVHRVIEKGFDEQGTYFITKGDNADTREKIRFEDIQWKTIGVIY
jgi:hypothetical protein